METILNNSKFNLILKNKKILLKISQKSGIPIDELEFPYIAINYYNPKIYNDEDVIIPFYFSDFYLTEYCYDTYNLKFNLRYELDGNVNYLNNLTAGDHEINLGKLSPGLHWYSLQVIDEHGRESRRIFNEILIVNRDTYDITEEETYTVTDDDLTVYSINKNNSEIEEDMVNNKVGLTKLFSDIKDRGYRKCILPEGTYRINKAERGGTIENKNCPICIPSEFTVDMNGATFKLHPYNDLDYGSTSTTSSLMVKMNDCFDSHLINGTLEGDYFERQENGWISGGNGEHCNTLFIYGGSFNTVENVTIKQTTGYNVMGALSQTSSTFGKFGTWVDNITIINGKEIAKEGYCTSNLNVISDALLSDHYMVASVWLAMGGLKGYHWNMWFHFYDNEDNFIESINVYQYTRCRIPDNAKKFRCTIIVNSSELSSVSLHHMHSARYCTIKNCHWIDNRTCSAPSQVQFWRYLNCDFTRSGQSITPAEIDFEDGWEQMQDIMIKNCEIKEGGEIGTADLIMCCGINTIFENNINFDIDTRYRVHGLTVRHNNGCKVSMKNGWMCGNPIRICDNELLKGLNLDVVGNDFFNIEKTKVKIKNNNIQLSFPKVSDTIYEVSNCTITKVGSWNNVHLKDCTIYIKQWKAQNEYSYWSENTKMTRCTFKLYEGFPQLEFSSNVQKNEENVYYRIFEECIFDGPTVFLNHIWNNFGTFDSCEFKDTFEYNAFTNNIGDIVFNNCKFNKSVTIYCVKSDAYLQFNNCEFLEKPILDNYAKTNAKFNNCIIPE